MDYVNRIMANARVKLIGAVDDGIKLELFNVVDEFCKETDIWQELISFTTVNGGSDIVYDIIPSEGFPLRLLDLRTTESKISAAGSMPIPGELHLFSPYEGGISFDALISLHPLDPTDVTDSFPVIGDWIWDRYNVLFTDGLISKMASQQDKPYSNPGLSAFHGQKFRSGLGVARADRVKQNVADGQAWRFPFFA